jgi:hypothetical protein
MVESFSIGEDGSHEFGGVPFVLSMNSASTSAQTKGFIQTNAGEHKYHFFSTK